MRKNILLFGHSYGSQFLESCNQYTQVFDKNKYKIIVVYMVGAPSEEIRKKTEAEEVIFLDCKGSETRYLKISIIKKMIALCREKKIHAVICHRYKPAYIMFWVAQFYKFAFLIFVMHAFETMRGLQRKLIAALLFRKNMFIAGVSDAVRDEIRRDTYLIPKENIITLYNILDYELFEKQLQTREEARHLLNLNSNDFVFGHIARLVKEKDQANLIKAFYQISEKCPRAKLIIIGTGKLDDKLKQQVDALNLSDKIIFCGFIPDAFQLMKAFDVFVLPSVEEAFGRVLLEAMVAYVPILASRIHGIPEVVGDSGFMFEAGNVNQLAKLMQQLYQLKQEELFSWGKLGRERMVSRFTMKTFQKNFWQHPYFARELQ